MALSGTFIGSTVGGGYRLEIDWSATQSITNNQSTVTAKVYWCSLGSSYTVNSSATKSGSTTIDGTATSWSTAGASLSGNQRKLVATTSKTVTHDSAGNKSVSISSTYSVAVDLGGYVSSVSASGTATLNSIPRETKLTSGQNWTAGNAITLNFDKKNSAYTTDVVIKVNGVAIRSAITGITGSSYTYTFTASENEKIFQQLALDTTSWNQASSIEVTTKSGSTTIGSMQPLGGTVSSPANTQVSGSSFTVGNSTTITLSSEQNSAFVYDLTAKVGTYTKTVLSKAGLSSPAWDTNADKVSILGQMPSNTATVTYTLTTYWANGTSYTKVKNADTYTVTASVNTTTEAPTFTLLASPNNLSYADTNTTVPTGGTVGLTGNSSYIIQNKSTMTVTLPSGGLASAKTGTSMKEYQCTFNGKTITVAHPATATTLTFVFNASDLNVSTNQNIVMKAVDNRTNSTSLTLSVNVIPYAPPVLTATASRDDGFSDPSTLTLSGSVSSLSVAGVNKNSVKTMTYQYRVSGGTYNAVTNFVAGTATFPAYKANDVALATQLTNTSAWDVQFIVTDQLSSTTIVKTVGVGQPVFFIDSAKKSVGVGVFPTGTGTFEASGTVQGLKLQTKHSGGQSLSLQDNSYVSGTTGMYNYIGFNDSANAFKAYLGFTSGRDNVLNVYNAIGDIKLTPMSGKKIIMGNILDMLNSNIEGVNSLHFNDIGPTEGVEWDSASGLNNWKIVVTDDAGAGNTDTTTSTNAYQLQFFRNGVRSMTLGTTGTLYATNGFYAQGGNVYVANGTVTGSLVHADGYMLVGTYSSTYGSGSGRIWYRNDTGVFNFQNSAGSAAGLYANGINTTSDRELKTNIVKDETSALDKINATPVYEYHYKSDLEIWEEKEKGNPIKMGMKNPSDVKKKKGLIWDEAPQDIRSDDDEHKAIDIYGMNSLMWKAIQELSAQVNSLNDKIKRR